MSREHQRREEDRRNDRIENIVIVGFGLAAIVVYVLHWMELLA